MRHGLFISLEQLLEAKVSARRKAKLGARRAGTATPYPARRTGQPPYAIRALRESATTGLAFLQEMVSMGDMFPYVALANDKQWQPGPYAGVELMFIHK